MPRWVSEATEEYAKRFGREINFSIKELKPEKRGAGVNAEQGMLAEEARILAAIPQGSLWWCWMSAAKRLPQCNCRNTWGVGCKKAKTCVL